jgi:hypothetical protein
MDQTEKTLSERNTYIRAEQHSSIALGQEQETSV